MGKADNAGRIWPDVGKMMARRWPILARLWEKVGQIGQNWPNWGRNSASVKQLRSSPISLGATSRDSWRAAVRQLRGKSLISATSGLFKAAGISILELPDHSHELSSPQPAERAVLVFALTLGIGSLPVHRRQQGISLLALCWGPTPQGILLRSTRGGQNEKSDVRIWLRRAACGAQSVQLLAPLQSTRTLLENRYQGAGRRLPERLRTPASFQRFEQTP